MSIPKDTIGGAAWQRANDEFDVEIKERINGADVEYSVDTILKIAHHLGYRDVAPTLGEFEEMSRKLEHMSDDKIRSVIKNPDVTDDEFDKTESKTADPQAAKEQTKMARQPKAPKPEESKTRVANATMAAAEIMQRMKAIMKADHKELTDALVTVDIQMWSSPVRVGGYEVFGKIKMFPWDQRVGGACDARIILDSKKFEAGTADEQSAMLDRLLQQIAVVTDKEGEVVRDKAHRPKLKRRKYDLTVNGFAACVARYGERSVESKEFRKIHPTFAQLDLFDPDTDGKEDEAEAPAPAEEAASPAAT